MTCIVGIVDKNKIWMGGDSAGVDDGMNLTARKDKKVFINGQFIMGFTSSFRMGQLLRWSFNPPKQPHKMDTEKFMNTLFIDAVRECLKRGGFARKKEEVESGGHFLVGYRGRLFQVSSDFQVGEALCEYDAVGCGGKYALGSLYASTGHPPQKRIALALETAETFSGGVREPFMILSL